MSTSTEKSYPTAWVESAFDNHTENEVYTEVPGVATNSSSIHSLLWPSLFTACIIAANVLTLVAFGVEKRLRTYNNYFIINLSIIDLLVGLNLVLTVVHTHVGYYPLNQALCKILGGIGKAIICASNFVVVIICADRHRATYDPINHFMTRSKRKAVYLNFLAWLGALAFWMMYITAWEFIDDFDNRRHCVRKYSRIPGASMLNSLVIFYLPFVFISVLYLRIFVKIRKTLGGKSVQKKFSANDDHSVSNSNVVSDFPNTSDIDIDVESVGQKRLEGHSPEKETEHGNSVINKKPIMKRESAAETRKATRTLLFIVLSFVITWLPQSINLLIYSIDPVLLVPGLPRPGRLFFGWLTYGNSLLNPISYAVSQPLLRATVKNVLLCRCTKISSVKKTVIS
ncbi:muscarinic acetylcholine receptor M4-like [Diadema antillarum]|uniref:muscarinic acetylcholine receptor M4-like n=1 Tax=Diadema antillarum TaxID=105358 RepID=UPI003A8C4719